MFTNLSALQRAEIGLDGLKVTTFDLEDKERPGQQKKFEDEYLEALDDKDRFQTLK